MYQSLSAITLGPAKKMCAVGTVKSECVRPYVTNSLFDFSGNFDRSVTSKKLRDHYSPKFQVIET